MFECIALQLCASALNTFDDCLRLLMLARRTLGEVLSSFEFMDAGTMQCVTENLSYTNPLAHTDAPFYILVETSGSDERLVKKPKFPEFAERRNIQRFRFYEFQAIPV